MDAAAGALRRTIPNAAHAVDGTTERDLSALPITSGAHAGSTADLRGCWITIQNKTGAAIYVLRGPTGVALPSSSNGSTIEDGAKEEYFVDERDEAGHFLRASAVGLSIGFDTAFAAIT